VAASAATVGNSGLTRAVASIQSALKKVQDFRTATISQINAVLTPINEARAIATV
jgi:DNA-binding winged helix-turn-helix (wHTH) protein